MSPQMDVAFNWLPAIFGGRQSARTFHFLTTFLFVLFTFGHVLMVLTTGLVNNMRCMITGWYREEAIAPVAEAEAPAPVAQEKIDAATATEPEIETSREGDQPLSPEITKAAEEPVAETRAKDEKP